ncbi:MAG: S46 family peptidase [Planctomycetota bacterium]|jgi:hypothetical protein
MLKYALIITTLCVISLGGCANEFVNPGGMWMPHQLADQADTLRLLGVSAPDALSDPLAAPLGAIVWLGGCSASFVSPDGLIVTNHHCANATLQHNSTPECNMLEDGFLAQTRADELPGEIGKKVWITQDIRNVTGLITDGLADIADPLARHKEMENRIKTVIADHEDLRNGFRCSIKRYFDGQEFYLITMLELRDVRLVYAPHSGIGWYGGDIDNWHWPRHTGDFTFLRAYVGPDGKPAEYSEENVPYRPKHYLKIAAEPLKAGDFVMVAGYPWRTQRWKTAGQARFACESANPRRIEILTDVAKVYKKLAAESEDLKIKTTPSIKGVMNYLKLLELVQDNIEKGDLIQTKTNMQTEFVEWVHADSAHKVKWAVTLDEIDRLDAERQADDYPNYLTDCITRYVRLIDAAHTIVRMAEERPKPDEERDPDFQERNWDRIIHGQQRMQTSYDRKIDKAILRFYLKKIMALPDEQKQPVLAAFFKSEKPDDWKVRKAINAMFTDDLKLEDADYRVELLENASLEDLRANPDPMIQLALRLRPITKELEDADKIYQGQMIVLRPQYVEAMKAFAGRPLAPDANGTLRVTYGTIKGYRPTPEADMYEPFTTLDQVVDKHTGQPPFDAPASLIGAVEHSEASPFRLPEIGDVPVNFLADLDITGGNSGSATLNRKGELVGLVFDGNSEALASNWLFNPDITRSIHVDIRYVLWIMQNVDHVDNLLNELGIN